MGVTMKRMFGGMQAAGWLLSLAMLGNPAQAIEIGDPAPEFQLQGLSSTVKLSDASGKLVYLDYWASWCGPCRQSFPWMNELQSRYGSQGLQVVAVNLDAKPEDARRFLEMQPASFAVAFDPKGQTPRLYGVKGMPSSFLIGRDGKVLWRHTGFKGSDKAELEQQIAAALKLKTHAAMNAPQ